MTKENETRNEGDDINEQINKNLNNCKQLKIIINY